LLLYESFLIICGFYPQGGTLSYTTNPVLFFHALPGAAPNKSPMLPRVLFLKLAALPSAMTDIWVSRAFAFENPNTACRSCREAVLDYPSGRVRPPPTAPNTWSIGDKSDSNAHYHQIADRPWFTSLGLIDFP